MKRTTAALFLTGTLLLAQGPRGFGGPGGGMAPGTSMMSGAVVTGAPFSAVEVRTLQQRLADGNTVNTSTNATRARDSQGRTYLNETITPAAATGKAPYNRITITDPVAGYRYELDSSTMIAVPTRTPAFGPARTVATPALGTVTRPDGAIITTTSQGTATINGVLATNTQVTEVIPAGAIGNIQPITTTRTTWVSQDLKLPVQIKTSDPRYGTSDVELTNISTGEPNAALFTVPSGFTIQRAGRGAGGPGGAFRRGGPPPQAQ